MNRHPTTKAAIALLGLWLVIIAVIGTAGNFPLNDDWAYAISVKHMLETGQFKLYNWGEMTLTAHIYWGYLFTFIPGFSFEYLRWSTLVLGGAGAIGMLRLGYFVSRSLPLAILAALLVMLNPLYLSMSFSFMTDVPFAALLIWSSYFFIRYSEGQSNYHLSWAIFFCIWALLIRQLALALPLAWLVTQLFFHRKDRSKWWSAFIPILIIGGTYFLYQTLMQHFGLLQGRFNDKLARLVNMLLHPDVKLLKNIAGYAIVIATYLGLFFAPLHVLHLRRRRWWIAGSYALIITVLLVLTGKTLPCLNNVLIDFGVGPTTLYDHYGNFVTGPAPQAPHVLWVFLTAVGVWCSAAWWNRFNKGFVALQQKSVKSKAVLFSFICIGIYVAPFLIVGLYDRYLIALFPFLATILLYQQPLKFERRLRIFSIAFLVIVGLFSVCATHDYLSWNRVRWQALEQLHEQGIPSIDIQGGVEHSTWFHFEENNPDWYTVIGDTYKLTFQPLPDHQIIETYEYSRWLPGVGQLFVLRKEGQ